MVPRILALDGLRGIAILLVMLFHFHTPLAGVAWAGEWFDRVAGAGCMGVNLFFVLSGFLITGILWRAKQQARYFRNFYARRTLRIFPLYYGTLFVSLALLPQVHHISDPKYSLTVQHQIWLWTYTSNFYESWAGRALPLFGHFWSLAVEEQFYLVWPFVVLWSGRRTLMMICTVCFIGAFVARLVLLHAGADPAMAVLRLTPCQLDGLATGAFLALVVDSPEPGCFQVWRTALRKVFVASTVVILLLIFAFPILVAGRHLPLSLCYSCWNVFFGTGLFSVVTGPSHDWLRCLLEVKALRTLGKYSYGVYVFHWPLGRLWLGLMEKWRGEQFGPILNSALIFQASYFLLAAGSSLLVASLSWRCYEKPFLSLKRYFEYHRVPAARSPTERCTACK